MTTLKRIYIILEKEQIKELKRIRHSENHTISAIIRAALDQYLKSRSGQSDSS